MQKAAYLLQKDYPNQNTPIMKTIITLCLTAMMTLGSHHNSSAQIASIPSAGPSVSNTSSNNKSLKVSNFNGRISKNKVLLNWAVGENQDADQFEVQKSTNGKTFVMAALVFGTDNADANDYQFYEKANKVKTYYRVKAIRKNGAVSYSPVYTAEPDLNKRKSL
jgi:hypothetical protein